MFLINLNAFLPAAAAALATVAINIFAHFLEGVQTVLPRTLYDFYDSHFHVWGQIVQCAHRFDLDITCQTSCSSQGRNQSVVLTESGFVVCVICQ